jgi:hypothetical protein
MMNKPKPTDEVRLDIKSSDNPMEIRNDGGGCNVCGRYNCKKVNHTPAATEEQTTVAKDSGWW